MRSQYVYLMPALSVWFELTFFHETGLSVWSHPAPCHHHSAWATHTQEPVHSDRDLLLDSDDDSVFPDDVATATRRSYDLSPSTSQFSYEHSELMDLDGDECDDASD